MLSEKKTSVYISSFSRSMHFVCQSAHSGFKPPSHTWSQKKCHLLLLTLPPVHPPRILNGKRSRKHSCSFSWLHTLSLTYRIIFSPKNAFYIATTFLGDARCENLLLIVSYALPFAAIHSCICGYSLGLQQTKIPALSQLIEQSARILFVVLLFLFVKKTGEIPSVKLAAAGIAAGETAAALFRYRC